MSDYQKALKTTFDTIRNVGLAALLLGAAAVILRKPQLAFDSTSLAVFQAGFLILTSALLQVANMVNWAYELRSLKINKVAYVVGGVLFIILLMQLYGAVSLSTIERAKSAIAP